ncbi:MAG TPA: Cof-type HAD-IIB family hydrolase [Porphyromonadaceae bacterium]|nr:Cof-type HAD-IIB family hydrolase [Porphyromonadaceae bacterium]
MVKAIFFDIDGTLISFKTQTMPESTKNAIKQLHKTGMKLFIATGRHFSAIQSILNVEFDGYITLNGCYCLQGTENVIFKKSIHRDDVSHFIDYLENEWSFPCLFVEEHSLSVNYIDGEMKFLMDLLKEDTLPHHSPGYYRDKELFQLTAFFKDDMSEEIMSRLPNSTYMRWYPTFADIICKGIDKGVGIDKICEYYGFSASETMAFGDGGNDIAMLQHAGIGIAMGNANDVVKQAADYVTDSVDDDGILNALKHFEILP